MSDEEGFLSRWSRRKQQAARGRTEARPESDPPGAAQTPPATAEPFIPPEPGEPQEPEVDLTSLPPIESIDAKTDITAFLRKGVPADLTRAALRRAWAEDPAIRNFIEVAENQWDFATGRDIPGFGPIEAGDDVRRMVAEVVDRVGASNDATPEGAPAAAKPEVSGSEAGAKAGPAQRPQSDAGGGADPRGGTGTPARDEREDDRQAPIRRRRHGGALPK